jgi:tRNA 2-thiouridine synthesizing protein C
MEEEGVVKKILYLNRKAPYGTIYALESLEVVLIGAAFEQDVSLAFIDDGVYQLKKDQKTSVNDGIGVKNFSKTYGALEGYDVEKLYVDKKSMEERGLSEEDLIVPVEVLNDTQMAELMDQQEVIFSF